MPTPQVLSDLRLKAAEMRQVEATAPNQVWQMDFTKFLVRTTWVRLLVVWTALGRGIELPGTGTVVAVCAGASAFSALVESLPLRLDDNITSTAAAAIVLAMFL